MDRDCANMARYWKRQGVDTSPEEVWIRITGMERSESLVPDDEDEEGEKA